MKPGMRLRSLASRICSPQTMDRLIDPVIGDMQREHDPGTGTNGPWERRWVLVQGYVAFWKVVALWLPALWIARVARERSASPLVRALAAAAVTLIVTTALLVAAPLQSVLRHERSGWMFLLLLPQSFPLTIPGVLLVGVLTGARNRPTAGVTRRAVAGVALAGSLASFATIMWLIPASNQAFRVTVAGREVSSGFPEMPVSSLRARALESRGTARENEAGSLFVAYHARWALVGAAGAFALFGLGVAARRARAAVAAGVAAIAYVVYVAYFFELGYLRASIFIDERLVILVVWLPNLMLTLVGLAFLKTAGSTELSAVSH
jgi:Lipopolysaccharide export system permease LptF/LptG